MDSSAVRQTFLDFFRSKQHTIVPGAPMVIKDDPSLMFTNAGMNQFKDIFLGNRQAVSKRIADFQRCLRVSGKHNDLEEVGHDTYHHTMFEMLGNWSFGDYFKKEAIEWAWELLTGVYGIDRERIYVTVFDGDLSDMLERDEETYEIWRRIVPATRILTGSKKDNFWEMGDTGPCGPCSEIHIDLRSDKERKEIPGSKLVNTGNALVIEIWNLVFIEFNRQSDGTLIPLPAKHVDTGMGFERLCMVLQGKTSTYETDLFRPVIDSLSILSGIKYGSDPHADVAMRVVADHLRAIAFAIADGQLPSNVKAGYVIRRILRRAVRYGYVFLHFRQPFICDLVAELSRKMGNFYPGLTAQQSLITSVIREEETSFLRTLEQGIQKFQQYLESETGISVISGSFAFELYDTYGFPVDLTELMARELGLQVDMEGFNEEMTRQQNRSRQAAIRETFDWIVLTDDTDAQGFAGYDTLQVDTVITRYRKLKAKGGERYQIVLARTPFYAESGGQAGDRGWLKSGNERLEVLDTVKENELIMHIVPRIFSDPGGPVSAEVNRDFRLLTANNHSATHLLHAALRNILGSHVEQRGSMVDESKLRFDFTHFARTTPDQIRAVEQMVNERIRENIPRYEERDVAMIRAKEMGAVALFGEKYGDLVRVIRFGEDFSTELCGGTHVPFTGQIGLFRIVSEGAIAAGIRRIEAVTGSHAEEYMYDKEDLLNQAGDLLKNPKDIARGIELLLEENRKLKKVAVEFGKIRSMRVKEELKAQIEEGDGWRFLASRVDMDVEDMKAVASDLRNEFPDLLQVLVSESNGKLNLIVAISGDLIERKNLHAGNMIRDLAKEIQGTGGGQPHIATAGGKDPGGIPALFAKARDLVI